MNFKRLAVGFLIVLCAASAHADSFIRKGGEWRSVVSGLTPEPKTIEMCFLPATPEQAIEKLTNGTNCTKRNVTVTGMTVVADIKCNNAEMLITSHMIGDSLYRGDITLNVGNGASAKSVHYTVEARWIGQCKPGETPF